MKYAPSYLKNSRDLINIIESLNVPSDAILVSADITALYPSIPINDAIKAVETIYADWL